MPSSPRTASDAAELERSRLQFEKMTQTPVPKLILGLAAPTILSMLITSGLRLPASAALSLASCWPQPQQLLPVSAAGARVAFAAFLRPLGRGLEKQKAAPASPPFICRWQRSAPLQSLPLPQKVRVLSAKAGENGMPFGKFAKERSNCL